MSSDLITSCAGIGQQNVTASQARTEVQDYAAANGWPQPDEPPPLLLRTPTPPGSRRRTPRLVARGYFACHSLSNGGMDGDVIRYWFDALTQYGFTDDQKVAVLASAMAWLCSWHIGGTSLSCPY